MERARGTALSAMFAGVLVACQSPAPGPIGVRPDAAASAATPDAAGPDEDAATGAHDAAGPGSDAAMGDAREEAASTVPLDGVVPRPTTVTPAAGQFRLSADSAIVVEPDNVEMRALGQYLAERLRPATGFPMTVSALASGSIRLTTTGADPALGDEGYELRIAPDGVTLAAPTPAGVFRGLQTIRQLLPPAIERSTPQPGPWALAAGTVRDRPRFAWRGAMLDLARHFFDRETLERFVDVLAYYKLNRLHLHLSDDQGWRLAVAAWPRLTEYGGSTAVGGGGGGYLTKADYSAVIAYAQQRYITVVPEIDVPGHTNAALASYAELNCTGVAPPLYTATAVGFSSLCIGNPTTDRFMGDVIGEIAALTPGPYLHLGGDEAISTRPADYVTFMSGVQKLVRAAGKQMIGWEEVAAISDLDPSTVVQHWQNVPLTLAARRQGARLIMSPASHAYLDMKYDAATPVGGTWAGFIDERHAYEWDPATQVPGVGEADIIGVEAPLWSETISTRADLELLALPRLAGHAEIGWSPVTGRSWDEYRARIASHGPRLMAMGVNFYRSSLVPWPP